MSTRLAMKALRISALSALLALLLMVWGVVDPHPLSLVVAMSVGQALGTLSFALYGLVVFLDLRHARVFSGITRRFSSAPPDAASDKPSD